MPIYEYQCQECGEVREELQRFDDPPPAECGECGGALRKLISAPAFQFKGSGWYVTDYANKGKGGGAQGGGDNGDAKGGSGSSSADGGKKADQAPAAKAASAASD